MASHCDCRTGWYATYWVKMLNDIEVLDQPDDNFWTKKAYLIPDTPFANSSRPSEGCEDDPHHSDAAALVLHQRPRWCRPEGGQTNDRARNCFRGDAALVKVLFSADSGATGRKPGSGRITANTASTVGGTLRLSSPGPHS